MSKIESMSTENLVSLVNTVLDYDKFDSRYIYNINEFYEDYPDVSINNTDDVEYVIGCKGYSKGVKSYIIENYQEMINSAIENRLVKL